MGADVYWIEGPWPGRLAIVPRPRGGDWLEDDVRCWEKHGLHEIVSMLTLEEVSEFELTQEGKWCQTRGIRFHSFSIPDRGVPTSVDAFACLIHELEAALHAGRKIGLHCRQGIGRSSLIAAALLISAGEDPEVVWKLIGKARGSTVPDTIEQRYWVRNFAQAHHG